MDMFVVPHLVSQPAGVDLRMLSQCGGHRLDHNVVEGYLHGGQLIETCSCLHRPAHVDVHGKVEVRGGELALGQSFGDGLTHL